MSNIFLRSMGLVALVCVPFSGCGDDPVAYSAPVVLNLKAKSGDVVQGVVDRKKSISSETGNPYGNFMKDAKEKLGKENPSRVELVSLTLLLGANSTGVMAFDKIFTGRVDVLLVMNGSKNSYPAGHVMDPSGSGPVTFNLDFEFANMAEQDHAEFFDGSFDVHIRGQAATDFSSKGAEADLQLTLQFEAFK